MSFHCVVRLRGWGSQEGPAAATQASCCLSGTAAEPGIAAVDDSFESDGDSAEEEEKEEG